MPEGFPPFLSPDDDGRAMDAELRRAARSIIRNRHRDIPDALLDDLIVHDDSLRAEYEDLLEKMRVPVKPNFPRSGVIRETGVKVFEVADLPDGTSVIVGEYRLEDAPPPPPKPNRPRRSVYNWALNYGQNRRVQ